MYPGFTSAINWIETNSGVTVLYPCKGPNLNGKIYTLIHLHIHMTDDQIS